jgi:hypothetical protein
MTGRDAAKGRVLRVCPACQKVSQDDGQHMKPSQKSKGGLPAGSGFDFECGLAWVLRARADWT